MVMVRATAGVSVGVTIAVRCVVVCSEVQLGRMGTSRPTPADPLLLRERRAGASLPA